MKIKPHNYTLQKHCAVWHEAKNWKAWPWSSLVERDEDCFGPSGKLLCLCQTLKNMQHMHLIIKKMFDCWADPVVNLLLLKSFMSRLLKSCFIFDAKTSTPYHIYAWQTPNCMLRPVHSKLWICCDLQWTVGRCKKLVKFLLYFHSRFATLKSIIFDADSIKARSNFVQANFSM